MGIPVTPKNIFPSNIQGLPTWYEVRVSEKGYLGRRDGIDLMVAVNAQSMEADIKSVRPGGICSMIAVKNYPIITKGIIYILFPSHLWRFVMKPILMPD